ncbi:nucleotidyl transferase AbiEii/AbiGii toxin family protein [Candidatus Pacearchaeota archaeon]|nr:nucleotidyl transferase AbiEii/AbiGii toxin family protein [Candidatus Pacearchaeota archaeon]
MITIETIKDIARLKHITNLGHAEKDYLLDLILLSISKRTKNELVFKGGTSLFKFYKLDRFSEDLDFTLKKELDIDKLLNEIIIDLRAFGVDVEIKEKKKAYNSFLNTLRIMGPLFNGNQNSLASVRIDINIKSSIIIEPFFGKYESLYPDIPSFSLCVMDEKEILVEKIRAILTRNYARDLYDLNFLLRKGVKPDFNLLNDKLEYYKEKFSKSKFVKKVNEKRDVWKAELEPFIIGDLLEFKDVKNFVLSFFE